MLDDCLVTRFISCHTLSSAELADGVEEIARALRSFHDSSVRLPTRFSVPDLLEDYAAIVRRRGGELPAEYGEAILTAARIAAALPVVQERPCHNDLLAGNVIRAREDGRLMIVDWEYAGMGDPRFDLGNLSINNDFDEATDERLLSAYYGERPSDAAARRAEADARALRRPRGGVGRRAGRRSPSSTSTSPATRASTSSGCTRPSPSRASESGLPPRRASGQSA